MKLLVGMAAVAVGLVLSGAPPTAVQSAKPAPAAPREAIPALLDAFQTYEVVSFPGGHTDSNAAHALLQALIRHPRFATTVNDIVVEFGSSRYQDLMDRYIRGEDVPEAALKHAWQDAVQAGTSLDNPNTAAFFRTVRDANRPLAPDKQVRVLLGDPPIDWDNVRTKADYRKWEIQRDSYPADLVRREVLAHRRRALIVWANGHLMRQEILTNYDMSSWQSQTIVSLLERSGTPVFTVRAEGSLTQWQADSASWKAASLTIVKGTVLGAADFSEFEDPGQRYLVRGENDFVPLSRERYVSRRLEEIVDAILYMPDRAGLGTAPLSPTLCNDPDYAKMRLARIALVGLPPREEDVVRGLCGLKK